MPPADSPGRTVKAAETAFSILESLNGSEGKRLTKIADDLYMAKSTVHRYLQTLLQRKYLVKEGERYHPSLRFLDLAFVLVAMATVAIAGLAAGDSGVAAQQVDENSTDNRSNATVAPDERLQGVLGVGEAELETEVDSRTFGLTVARAASNDSARADAVAAQLGELEQRLGELEQARENCFMSEGAYRARMATVAAELEGTERLANESANASEGLDPELLDEKGINATAIQTLKDRANELGGQEVADIARSKECYEAGSNQSWNDA